MVNDERNVLLRRDVPFVILECFSKQGRFDRVEKI